MPRFDSDADASCICRARARVASTSRSARSGSSVNMRAYLRSLGNSAINVVALNGMGMPGIASGIAGASPLIPPINDKNNTARFDSEPQSADGDGGIQTLRFSRYATSKATEIRRGVTASVRNAISRSTAARTAW